MPETENEEGAEITHAPGEDLSLQSTETLLEEMASTITGTEVTEAIRLHYTEMGIEGPSNQIVLCASFNIALKNAKIVSASSTVAPRTVRITRQKIITTPEVDIPIPEETPWDSTMPTVVQGASWKAPKSHPNVPELA